MPILWQDVRLALRMLRKSPGFASVAVLSLALGIGANTTIFSLVNALLLRPLPVERPEELVMLYGRTTEVPFASLSYPDFADLRARCDAFRAVVAYEFIPLNLGVGDESRFVTGSIVSGNYFDALGVRLASGRGFLPEEDRVPDAAPVAVLSDRLWKRHFGGNPALVGGSVTLNGTRYTVVGIAPPEHTGLMRGFPVEVWVPMMMQRQVRSPGTDLLGDRGRRWLMAIARLKPGVSVERAEAQVGSISRQLESEHPESNRGWGMQLRRASRVTIHPNADLGLYLLSALLLCVVGLVLLVACANLAGLLLARGVARRREFAVRLALGASRARLVRQMLTESGVIALLGGAAGLLCAIWTGALLTQALSGVPLPVPIEISLDTRPDVRVFAYALVLSLLTGFLFGLLPALAATRRTVVPALKEESGATAGRASSRLRGGLVVAQMALTVLLLLAAGLCLRSLGNAHAMDPGFRTKDVYAASLDLGLRAYDEPGGRAFYSNLLQRLEALPGALSASLTLHVPLTLSLRTVRVLPEDSPGAMQPVELGTTSVAPRYFQTLGIGLLRGREFSPGDAPGAPRVAILNETAAARIWPGQNPLGRRLRIEAESGESYEVVGVARAAKYQSLGEQRLPFVYLCYLQNFEPDATVLLRATGSASQALAALRREIRSLDPNLPTLGIQPLEEKIGVSLLLPRLAAVLFGALGALGLGLALVGIYGMISYNVSRRTREIGIRMALGARRGDVLRLVLKQCVVLTGVGLLAGLVSGFALTRFLAILLYGISPTDTATFLLVPVILLGASLLACYLPARRAAGVDPLTALRYE